MPHKKLFIPGPVEVHPDVLKAMSAPMIGHRSSDYSELQKRVTEKIQKLAFTSHPVLFSASSGSGLMEGSPSEVDERQLKELKIRLIE